MPQLLVGLAQLNLTVGDLSANTTNIISAYRTARSHGAQLVVFSELAVTGYPPEDLLLKPAFLRACADALGQIAASTEATPAIVGFPELAGTVYNSAAVCADGRVQAIVRKQRLPNYSVFDEQRYFTAGTQIGPLIEVSGISVGVSICEDIWDPGATAAQPGSLAPVLAEQVAAGAQLLISVNGSPYQRSRQAERESHIAAQARAAGTALVYVNQVGAQDELIFDGGSCVVNASGNLLARLPAFERAIDVVQVPIGSESAESESADPRSTNPSQITSWPEPLAEVWQALVLALHDYVTKNGFSDVVIGTSGGVDSSMVTAVAVDALGAEHVHAVSMPSRYSSDHSSSDALMLAKNLGADYRSISIEPAHYALANMLEISPDVSVTNPKRVAQAEALTEQNLQSRIRGVILMALSNRHGWLVLTTGNKTELSVGYSTLYGDTAGGYAVIKDCPKLLVYELCRWRNAQTEAPWIPQSVIDKPPSAELSPGQLDEDHLPPYQLLDPLVEGYVDGDLTTDELIDLATARQDLDADEVRRITRLVDLAEYKRRQSPLGPRISAKSFGKDRRMPVTNRFR